MNQNPIATALIAGSLLLGGAMQAAASPAPQTGGGVTNVSTAAADRDATQKIRKAIMDDKTLSTYAHNVKILAKEGKVTLRGPVRSETEKQTVSDMASAVVGPDNVTNELTIQPAK
jgi:osmotically-inducible protein OsmY